MPISATHVMIEPDKVLETTERVILAAKKGADLSDRSWLAILMLFGLVSLSVILYWHRVDQQAVQELYTTTIRQNTECLTKVSVALDRLDRRAP